jgi:RNA polymerase sigma-70 factor (ECF subfamily)
VCWQLKQREALRPLLQLSTLEDEGQELADAMPPLDVQVARNEMKDLLRRAVEQLEQPYRAVYELRDIEELTGEEVTRRLKISLPAMKSRLHRARQTVRHFLDEALAGNSVVR